MTHQATEDFSRFSLVTTSLEEADQVIEVGMRRAPALSMNGVMELGLIRDHVRKHGGSNIQAKDHLSSELKAYTAETLFRYEVAACVDVLRMVHPSGRRNVRVGSYGLKHDVENFFGLVGGGLYVPNVAMIIAAYGMYFEAKAYDDNPNVDITVDRKMMEGLRSLQTASRREGHVDVSSKPSGTELILAKVVKTLLLKDRP